MSDFYRKVLLEKRPREVEREEVLHKGMRGGRSNHLMVATHA